MASEGDRLVPARHAGRIPNHVYIIMVVYIIVTYVVHIHVDVDMLYPRPEAYALRERYFAAGIDTTFASIAATGSRGFLQGDDVPHS